MPGHKWTSQECKLARLLVRGLSLENLAGACKSLRLQTSVTLETPPERVADEIVQELRVSKAPIGDLWYHVSVSRQELLFFFEEQARLADLQFRDNPLSGSLGELKRILESYLQEVGRRHNDPCAMPWQLAGQQLKRTMQPKASATDLAVQQAPQAARSSYVYWQIQEWGGLAGDMLTEEDQRMFEDGKEVNAEWKSMVGT